MTTIFPRPVTLQDVILLGLICSGIVGAGKVTSILAGTRQPIATDHYLHKIKKPTWTPNATKIRNCFKSLYIVQAPAIWLISMDSSITWSSPQVILFIMQFGLYILWPVLFFRYKKINLSLLDAVILWFLIDFTIYFFWQVNIYAALLMYPYLSWITTAVALNASIYSLNLTQNNNHHVKDHTSKHHTDTKDHHYHHEQHHENNCKDHISNQCHSADRNVWSTDSMSKAHFWNVTSPLRCKYGLWEFISLILHRPNQLGDKSPDLNWQQYTCTVKNSWKLPNIVFIYK